MKHQASKSLRFEAVKTIIGSLSLVLPGIELLKPDKHHV
jgi:hypothetical protein